MSNTQHTAPAFQVAADLLDRYGDWTECQAFRFVKHDDGTYELEVTNDMDAITAPEATS